MLTKFMELRSNRKYSIYYTEVQVLPLDIYCFEGEYTDRYRQTYTQTHTHTHAHTHTCAHMHKHTDVPIKLKPGSRLVKKPDMQNDKCYIIKSAIFITRKQCTINKLPFISKFKV